MSHLKYTSSILMLVISISCGYSNSKTDTIVTVIICIAIFWNVYIKIRNTDIAYKFTRRRHFRQVCLPPNVGLGVGLGLGMVRFRVPQSKGSVAFHRVMSVLSCRVLLFFCLILSCLVLSCLVMSCLGVA
jgi:hypothetical protein